ncbi:hypothetical protein L486_06563 [Kwoniella mangroviensis CBS 10435]|uniref:Uncharacterized protein n=1 Tax=Kwoniella mangroviensis CBS 10435 TaxID=1331196 RepID=A0A1B9IKC1_9TREE|nr:hypothetical protein L486_06563 [Kwoniella mangroviensis CBS 10435]
MRTNLEVPLTSSMSDGNPTPGQDHNHEGSVPSTCSTSSSTATIMKKDENTKTVTAPSPTFSVKPTSTKPGEKDKGSTVIKEVMALQPIEVQALQEEIEVRLREGEKIIFKEGTSERNSERN